MGQFTKNLSKNIDNMKFYVLQIQFFTLFCVMIRYLYNIIRL